jgi:hypothetical protein
MQAGRASAVGSRSTAFSGRTFPCIRPGRPGPWLLRIPAVLSVCQFQQCLSAMMCLPPTERASSLQARCLGSAAADEFEVAQARFRLAHRVLHKMSFRIEGDQQVVGLEIEVLQAAAGQLGGLGRQQFLHHPARDQALGRGLGGVEGGVERSVVRGQQLRPSARFGRKW